MRRFALLAATVVAALGLTASSVMGEGEAPANPSPVELSAETSGQHCSGVTLTNHVATGTCAIHGVSTGNFEGITHTIFGETIAFRCSWEVAGALDESGRGFIGMSQVTVSKPAFPIDCHPDAGGVNRCSEAAAAAVSHGVDWDLQLYEASTGQIWMDTELCLENTVVGTVACDIWLQANETRPNDHLSSFSADSTPSPGGGHACRNSESGGSGMEFWGFLLLEVPEGGGSPEVTH